MYSGARLRKFISKEVNKTITESIVSDEIKESANFLIYKIIELEKNISPFRWSELSHNEFGITGKSIKEQITIDVENLFFENLILQVRFVKLDKNQEISQTLINSNNYGNFDDSMVYLNGNKIKNGKIYLNISYFEDSLENGLTKGVVYHELLHYYESWQRLKKYGNPKTSDLSNIKNSIQTRLRNEVDNKFLNGISEIIYYFCYFERNAFMATLYGELIDRNENTLGGLNKIFKKTKTYENYYINLLKPELIFNKNIGVEKDDLDKINETIKETIKKYNQINPNNKYNPQKIPFYYKGGTVESYMKKILGIISTEQKIVERKINKVFKKVLYDRKSKLKSVNEKFDNIGNELIFGRL